MIVHAMQTRTGYVLVGNYPATVRRRARVDEKGNVTLRPGDPVGLHATFMDVGGAVRPTASGQRKIARRRAKNAVAKQSRKVNR
jgi:hypothetical protein